mmetsp:Transcript_15802/g.37271  ORF Transcript_15802/g.37271 Transcript_15802/m.37271 type:complete len:278 (-) Transcript_15802:151-984(-)
MLSAFMPVGKIIPKAHHAGLGSLAGEVLEHSCQTAAGFQARVRGRRQELVQVSSSGFQVLFEGCSAPNNAEVVGVTVPGARILRPNAQIWQACHRAVQTNVWILRMLPRTKQVELCLHNLQVAAEGAKHDGEGTPLLHKVGYQFEEGRDHHLCPHHAALDEKGSLQLLIHRPQGFSGLAVLCELLPHLFTLLLHVLGFSRKSFFQVFQEAHEIGRLRRPHRQRLRPGELPPPSQVSVRFHGPAPGALRQDAVQHVSDRDTLNGVHHDNGLVDIEVQD